MTSHYGLGEVANTASGALLVLLGLALLFLRPRTRVSWALAMFSMGFGAGWLANYGWAIVFAEGAREQLAITLEEAEAIERDVLSENRVQV